MNKDDFKDQYQKLKENIVKDQDKVVETEPEEEKENYKETIEHYRVRLENVDKEIEQLKRKSNNIPKEVLMSVAGDINKTLQLIGEVDDDIHKVLDAKDDFFKAIDNLDYQNRLDESRSLTLLKLNMFYNLIGKSSILNLNLRNELEQLQSKIRDKS